VLVTVAQNLTVPISSFIRTIVLLFSMLFISNVLAEDRSVLIIGNESYGSTISREGAERASDIVAKAFESVGGYSVEAYKNLARHNFKDKFDSFLKASKGSELVVVYYVGHAIQLNGVNYLVPSGTAMRSKSDRQHLVRVSELFELAPTQGKLLLFLDTCENNPLASGWGDAMGRSPVCGEPGSVKELPKNTLISFARHLVEKNNDPLSATKNSQRFSKLVSADTSIEKSVKNAFEPSYGAIGSISWRSSDNISQSISYGEHHLNSGLYSLTSIDNVFLLESTKAGVQLARETESSSSKSFEWKLEPHKNGLYSIRILTNDIEQNLEISRSGSVLLESESLYSGGVWKLEKAGDGSDYVFYLRHHRTGHYLSRRSGQSLFGQKKLNSSAAAWIILPLDPTADFGVARNSSRESENQSQPISSKSELIPFSVNPSPADARIRILNILKIYEAAMELAVDTPYQIEVSKDGYQTSTQWIRLTADNATLNVKLKEIATEIPEDLVKIITASNSGSIEPVSELEIKRVFGNFEEIVDVLTVGDTQLLDSLLQTTEDQEKADLLLQIAANYSSIESSISNILVRNSDASITGTLRILRMVRENGDFVIPTAVIQDTRLVSRRTDSGWKIVSIQ